MKTIRNLLLALTPIVLLSCSGERSEVIMMVDEDSNPASPASPLEEVFLDEAPADPITVSAARENAQPGDVVTVAGKIAGVMNPFTEGYATMVITDEALKTCDMIPGDECLTPWDACCEAPETLKKQRMTVQVLAEGGIPIAESLKGVHDLAELDSLVVTGTVNENSTEENLVLDLSGIYRVPPTEE